jgi:hypothetical protein
VILPIFRVRLFTGPWGDRNESSNPSYGYRVILCRRANPRSGCGQHDASVKAYEHFCYRERLFSDQGQRAAKVPKLDGVYTQQKPLAGCDLDHRPKDGQVVNENADRKA